MGKIRVKTLGEEEKEKLQKERDEKRREVKRVKKETEKGVRPPGGKGGQRVKTVGPSEEETEKTAPVDVKVQKKATTKKPHIRSKRYKTIREKVDKSKWYSFDEALAFLKENHTVKFGGSVDAHFNLTKKPKELNLKNPKPSKNETPAPVSYEKKFPLAHAKLGSLKDDAKKIETQLESLVKKIGKTNIVKLTLTSTMGPGLKVKI